MFLQKYTNSFRYPNFVLLDAKSKLKAAKLAPPKTESKAALKPSATDVRPKTVQRNGE